MRTGVIVSWRRVINVDDQVAECIEKVVQAYSLGYNYCWWEIASSYSLCSSSVRCIIHHHPALLSHQALSLDRLLAVPIDVFTVIGMWICVGSAYQTSSKSSHWRPGYDVLAIFKMAVTASQIYFLLFSLWWRIAIRNVEIYLHTKFRLCSSIRSRDIIISGFWEQTAAILKFCFRFLH